MADKKAKPRVDAPSYAPYRHEHPVAEHKHGPAHEHTDVAELSDRLDKVVLSFRDEQRHLHPLAPHDHRDLRGHFRGVVRALLEVIEVGSKNSEQVKAIHAVRVIIGDAHGSDCTHENVAYEAGDCLICQDCRKDVTPDAGG